MKFTAVVKIALSDVIRNVEELDLLFLSRNWQRQSHEGVKSNGHLVANAANQSRFVLAMEQINDDTFVSDKMLRPCFKTGFGITLARGVSHFDVRLLELAIEVLTEEIEDRIYALLGIVLAIALKLLGVFSKHLFEHGWPCH